MTSEIPQREYTASQQCAYCGASGALTKEHIIPKFLYRHFPRHTLGYNARADKFMHWQAQVRDVCGACNSGPLSRLDDYARTFLAAIDCAKTYTTREPVTIQYDYHQLLRWLLKLSYNAARGLSEAHLLLKQTIPFILGMGRTPAVAFLTLEMLRDTPVSPEDQKDLPDELRGCRHIPTHMFRVGPAILQGHDVQSEGRDEYCVRFVAINAWYFTVCLVDGNVPRAARHRLAALFRSMVPDAVELKSNRRKVTLVVSRRTGLEAYWYQGMRVREQWLQYVQHVNAHRHV